MECRLTRFSTWAPVLLGALCSLGFSSSAMSQVERHALVIGNSAYPDKPLNNPSNDADGVYQMLRNLNFDVVLEKNLDSAGMQRAIDTFERKLPAGSLAVFYFAGHGTQENESNYLIPIARVEEFEEAAIDVDSIVASLQASASGARIVLLDACRTPPPTAPGRGMEGDDPTPAALTRGFAQLKKQPSGTLIAYATAPGRVASDGSPGTNGVFTAALLTQLEQPGLDVHQVLQRTSRAVYYDTNGEQEPHFLSSLKDPVYLRPESPEQCLDLLADPVEPGAGPRLGRVLREGQILEPVLVWQDGEGDRFRHCADNGPTRVSAEKVELFESALITRFRRRTLAAIPLYRHVGGVGYVQDQAADLTLNNTDHMLESKRTTGEYADEYVEVVGSGSMDIIQDRKDILLIASRSAMEAIELETWDEPWGTRPGDSRIGRAIHWWQLEDSGDLRVHTMARSFAELADRLTSPGGTTALWERMLQEGAAETLSQAAYTLMIADTAEHVELARSLMDQAEQVNSATFDIAKLEKAQDRRREKEQLELLEEAATRGRFWLLGRYFDLAAILPERIAGQVRFAYLKSNESLTPSDDVFLKTSLILSTNSPDLQVANAIYRDQAPTMNRTAGFLECLLADEVYGAQELTEVLGRGLERSGLPSDRWNATTDVDTAFRLLFQGLDLPSELPVAKHLFGSSIERQSPALLELVQSLQSFLAEISNEGSGECEIALLPDSVFGDSELDAFEVVLAPSPTGGSSSNTSFPESALYTQAQEAKDSVRLVLRDLIHVKGARHTRNQMVKGYRRFDHGNALLHEVQDSNSELALQEAIDSFVDAHRIFSKAYEEAFRAEHTKPRVRVH